MWWYFARACCKAFPSQDHTCGEASKEAARQEMKDFTSHVLVPERVWATYLNMTFSTKNDYCLYLFHPVLDDSPGYICMCIKLFTCVFEEKPVCCTLNQDSTNCNKK